MVWKCTCGTQNELYHLFCKDCRKEMPQRERNKVYHDELLIQIKECAILLKNSAPVQFVKSLLLTAKKSIVEILSGTKKEDLKFLIIPIVFFSFIIINIITQVAGMKIAHSRMEREKRSAYCVERRAALNENIRLKLDYAIDESGFFKADTPTNKAVKEHLEMKKNHLLDKSKIVIDVVIENLERGFEKCRLYFE